MWTTICPTAGSCPSSADYLNSIWRTLNRKCAIWRSCSLLNASPEACPAKNCLGVLAPKPPRAVLHPPRTPPMAPKHQTWIRHCSPSTDLVKFRKLAFNEIEQTFEDIATDTPNFENRWDHVYIYVRFIKTRPEVRTTSWKKVTFSWANRLYDFLIG